MFQQFFGTPNLVDEIICCKNINDYNNLCITKKILIDILEILCYTHKFTNAYLLEI